MSCCYPWDRSEGYDDRRNEAVPEILLLEDELPLLIDMQDRLERLGYRLVGPAGSVDKAHRVLDDEIPDAAVLNINLNGQPVAPIVHRLLSQNVPCLLVTAYTARGMPDQALTELPRLHKPVREAVLKQTLEALVG